LLWQISKPVVVGVEIVDDVSNFVCCTSLIKDKFYFLFLVIFYVHVISNNSCFVSVVAKIDVNVIFALPFLMFAAVILSNSIVIPNGGAIM
jgi:hypothetical protein